MRPVTISEVTCFQRCEREWQHRYLERRDGLIAAETLSRGKRVHERLATWWGCEGIFMDGLEMHAAVERAMMLGYAAFYERPHLSSVRVNVPFRTTIGGVDVVGECDAVGDELHNVHTGDGYNFDVEATTVVVEHKTTTRDITPGSAYWREVVTTDPQISTYLAAFPGATVLYDVLRVPSLRQYEATKTRKEPESDEDFVSRILADMAETPGKYFQRATVVRLESESKAFEDDLRVIAGRIHHPLYQTLLTGDGGYTHPAVLTPRNAKSCHAFGRPCDFFGVCWEGQSIESYPQREKNHSEEVAERADRQR